MADLTDERLHFRRRRRRPLRIRQSPQRHRLPVAPQEGWQNVQINVPVQIGAIVQTTLKNSVTAYGYVEPAPASTTHPPPRPTFRSPLHLSFQKSTASKGSTSKRANSSSARLPRRRRHRATCRAVAWRTSGIQQSPRRLFPFRRHPRPDSAPGPMANQLSPIRARSSDAPTRRA